MPTIIMLCYAYYAGKPLANATPKPTTKTTAEATVQFVCFSVPNLALCFASCASLCSFPRAYGWLGVVVKRIWHAAPSP